MRLILRSRPFFWMTLLLITIAAGLIRWHDINQLPAGLYPDEAMNGTNAIDANESGDYKIFYPDNFGREGLFINIQAFSLRLFGTNIPALKLPSVLFGTLAVLGVGLLAWELFRSRYAALMAAALMATSYWAINFSRIGFRAIMVPFLLSFSFFLFFRGLRNRRYLPFALAGLLFGTGLHTYVAFRLAPFILILLFPFLLLSYESFIRRYWKHAFIFVIGAAVTAGPMLYAFTVHPEIFSSRSSAISIFEPAVNHGDFPGTLGKTFGLSLIKYNFVGDQNWRHNYPPYPVLDPITGVFFLAGFLFSCITFFRLLADRFRTGRRDVELPVHAFILIAFLVMLAPEFLTDESLPHALRSIGTQPSVFLLAAIPPLFLFRTLSKAHGGTKIALALSLSIALFTSASWNLAKYFILFRDRPEQYASFNADFRNMSDYLASLPEETRKYVVPESFIAVRPIVFLTHDRVKNLTIVDEDTVIRPPAILIPQKKDPNLLSRIRRLVPDAYEERVDPYPGTGSDFQAIIIP